MSAASSLAAVRGIFTRKRLTGASSVLVGTSVASYVIRLASTLILTRLLAPDAFGALSIIGSIFFIIGMITDAGFEAYVVRHEREDPHFLNAIWTLHLGRGALIALMAVVLAWPVALVLEKPQVAPLLAVAGISLAIDGAASLSMFTAMRRDMVRRLSMIDVAGQATQFIVGAIAAWLMRSAWALVVAMIAGSIVRTVASYVVFPDARQRLHFDRGIAGELWKFSRVIAASSALTLAISQVDKLVLGRALTLEQFGIYSIAANLASASWSIASRYVSRIFYPALAATWRNEPENIKRVYYDLRGLLFFAYLFGGGLLIGSAPLIIEILYDPRYLQAGLYLRLLAISTTVIMLTNSGSAALVAIGKPGPTVTANLIRLAWLLPVGLGAYFVFGPIGLIVALGVLELPPYLYLSYEQIRSRLFDFRQEVRPWLAIGAGVGAGLAFGGLAKLILPF